MGSTCSSAFGNCIQHHTHIKFRAVEWIFSSAFIIIHKLNIELCVRPPARKNHLEFRAVGSIFCSEFKSIRGWSGGAMVLGKLPVPGRPTIWMIVGQGPIVLAVGAGGGCLDIFTLLYHFYFLSPSLWETTRYRLKYCLKGPFNPKQPTNKPNQKHTHFEYRALGLKFSSAFKNSAGAS